MRPAAQRKAVEHARQLFGISERRACTIFGVDRTSVRYAPRRSDDGDLRSRLREIAAERRRFGYRRLGIMLAREGLVMNHKKLRRLYREEKLQVRRRGGRKRALDLFITALRYTGTLHRSIFSNKNLTLIGCQEDPTAWAWDTDAAFQYARAAAYPTITDGGGFVTVAATS